MSRLRIGVLAPEFLPAVGGMPAYAAGLSASLADTDDVTLYTLEGRGVPGTTYEQRPILSRDLGATRRRLARERVDVWLTLNAGLVALAPRCRAPMFATLNGNDFLNPWLFFHRPWIEMLESRIERARYLWRYHTRLRSALRRRDLRRGIEAARHLFSISRASASLASRIYPNAAGKITIVPPGVAEHYFERPAVDRCGRTGPLHLLTVSRLDAWTRRKNIDGVLHGVASLPRDVVSAYTIVGDGDDRGRLEGMARTLGLADRVRFAGRLTADALLECYHAADLFVLAARAAPHDVEGFGIVYAEAAATGLPSICSAEGGATDAVDDGRTGIVIGRSDPDEVAGAIRAFAATRERYRGGPIRAFAEAFRWPRIAAVIRDQLARAA